MKTSHIVNLMNGAQVAGDALELLEVWACADQVAKTADDDDEGGEDDGGDESGDDE